MSYPFRNVAALAVVAAAGLVLGACTYERNHPVSTHFYDFSAAPPRGNTVSVCSAYGCNKQTRVRFSSAHISEIRKVMDTYKRTKSAADERRAVAYAISWMEKHVGRVVGTSKDRPGMDYAGSGDPTQQDCVDEATNTTSYLMVLSHNDLLKFHRVGTPFSKGNILAGVQYWPHWTAVLYDNETGTKYAVDSWIYKNGENPAIVEADKWYLDSLDNLPEPTA